MVSSFNFFQFGQRRTDVFHPVAVRLFLLSTRAGGVGIVRTILLSDTFCVYSLTPSTESSRS